MGQGNERPVEETLDPDDWEAMRALGHRMVDDMLDHLQSLPERAVWQHAPQTVTGQNRVKFIFTNC